MLFKIPPGRNYAKAFSEPLIPLGLDVDTGEMRAPHPSLPSGLGCGMVCPVCLENGRSAEDARLVMHVKHRINRDGQREAHFQHHRRPPESFPCFMEDTNEYGDSKTETWGGGETALHRLTGEFFAWYYSKDDSAIIGDSSGAKYPDSNFRWDVRFIDKRTSEEAFIEVEYRHLVEREKLDYFKSLDRQVVALRIYRPDREFLLPRLRRWNQLTLFGITPHLSAANKWYLNNIAEEIFDYFFNEADGKAAQFKTRSTK